MIILQAILLGIIEGLTEFLPISSTGHLILAQHAIGYKDAAEMFTVVVQVGAVAAVVWFYRRDLIEKCQGLVKGDKVSVSFWQKWVLATIPAALAGLILEKHLSSWATPNIVAVSLIVGGIIIWMIETYHTPVSSPKSAQFGKLSPVQALKVGCYQALSLIPGVSRSGATIMGGLVSGVDRVTATAFSFYLSIPILVLASGYKLLKDHQELANVPGGGVAVIVGVISSFITGLLLVSWLLKYVTNHDFKPFAYYRIFLGIVVLLVLR